MTLEVVSMAEDSLQRRSTPLETQLAIQVSPNNRRFLSLKCIHNQFLDGHRIANNTGHLDRGMIYRKKQTTYTSVDLRAATSELLHWHPSAVVAARRNSIALAVSLRTALRVTLVMLAVVVVVSRLGVHVGRIVGGRMMLTGVVVWRLMHCCMDWRRHGAVQVHILVGWMHVIVLHSLSLGFFVLLLLFSFSDRIHSVVLVGFALVELFFFSSELLPGCANEAGNGASLGRNATL
jgi:hypothetical protein